MEKKGGQAREMRAAGAGSTNPSATLGARTGQDSQEKTLGGGCLAGGPALIGKASENIGMARKGGQGVLAACPAPFQRISRLSIFTTAYEWRRERRLKLVKKHQAVAKKLPLVDILLTHVQHCLTAHDCRRFTGAVVANILISLFALIHMSIRSLCQITVRLLILMDAQI